MEEEGRESISASEELTCGSMKLWLLLRDMVSVLRCVDSREEL